jgi:hypothetical protein
MIVSFSAGVEITPYHLFEPLLYSFQVRHWQIGIVTSNIMLEPFIKEDGCPSSPDFSVFGLSDSLAILLSFRHLP